MKTTRLTCAILASLLYLGSLAALKAQSYAINWHKIAGGGGSSVGGQYALSGAIGQSDASGSMTGGVFSLTGGFWSLFAVQTPGAPFLSISRSGSAITVFWQDVSGWTLQQSATLVKTATWSTSSGATTANGTNYLTLSKPPGNLFFRLER